MTERGDQLIAVKIQAALAVDKELEERIKAVYTLLDPFEIDLTYDAFEAAFIAEVELSGQKHFNIQKMFLQAYIPAEFGKPAVGLDYAYEPMSAARREALKSSLSTVTRAGIKTHSAKGHSIVKAYADAGVRAASVGKRSARDPARLATASISRRTKGLGYYKRVLTGAESCPFCHMIASRGAVYTIDTVEGQWHDNCDCEPVPASADSGPTPNYDQSLMVKKKKTGLDKEKIKENILAWERYRAAAGHRVVPSFPESRTAD